MKWICLIGKIKPFKRFCFWSTEKKAIKMNIYLYNTYVSNSNLSKLCACWWWLPWGGRVADAPLAVGGPVETDLGCANGFCGEPKSTTAPSYNIWIAFIGFIAKICLLNFYLLRNRYCCRFGLFFVFVVGNWNGCCLKLGAFPTLTKWKYIYSFYLEIFGQFKNKGTRKEIDFWQSFLPKPNPLGALMHNTSAFDANVKTP